MDVFYNPDGIGDVLILPLEDADRYEVKHENIGDITKITKEDGTVVGYNIFQASTNVNLTEKGKITLTAELLDQIKDVFQKQGVQDSLEFDLSPKFVIGYVKTKEAHEDADKLNICQVDTGGETLQIVCGAPNIDAGQKVVVAKVGATMPSGMKIKPTELRGVPSNGMICSQKELGLPDAPKEKGIYVLDDSYRTGEPFEI